MAAETATWVGQQLAAGRYEVTAQLGAGGMGFVYRARDRQSGRDVVVKVPRRAMLEDPEYAGRFAREVRTLAKLEHAHIVKVFDVGEHAGLPFVVLQFLAGGSLSDRLRHPSTGKRQARPAQELAGWLPGVATALDFIHERKYLHRDVKPDNILFDAQGHVYLSDFGVVKALAGNTDVTRQTVLTGSGVVFGTPQYMAPELILGQRCDGRVDQYALGIVVYEMLCGRFPFDGPTAAAVFLKQTTEKAPLLHEVQAAISRSLSATVHKALAKHPGERYPACRDLASAVLDATHTGGAAATTGIERKPGATRAIAGVTVACPECGQRLGLPAGAEGKQVRCPHCQKLFDGTWPPPMSAVIGQENALEEPIASDWGRGASLESSANKARNKSVPRKVGRPHSARKWIMAGGAGIFLLILASISLSRLLGTREDAPADSPFAKGTAAQDETKVPPLDGTSGKSPPASSPVPPAPTNTKPGPPEIVAALRIASPLPAMNIDVGQSQDVLVSVERLNCKGPVDLKMLDLPTGLTARSAVVPADKSEVAVQLSAVASAQEGSSEVRVVASLGKITAEKQVRIAVRKPTPPPTLYVFPIMDVDLDNGTKVLKSIDVRIKRTNCEGPVILYFETGMPSLRAKPSTITADTDTGKVVLYGTPNQSGEQMMKIVAKLGDVTAQRVAKLNVRASGLTYQLRLRLDLPVGDLSSAAFSPAGRDAAVAITGYGNGSKKEILAGDIRVYNLETGKERFVLKGNAGRVSALAFSADGLRILSACGDIRTWNVSTRQMIRRFAGASTGRLWDVRWSASGTQAVSASDAGVELWDVASGKALRQIKGHEGPVFCAAMLPDGRRILSGGITDNTLRLWDAQSGKQLRVYQGAKPGGVSAVSLSADGRRAFFFCESRIVRLWDVEKWEGIHDFSTNSHRGNHGIFSPNGRQALISGAGNDLKLWDLDTKQPIHHFQEVQGAAVDLAFSADGRSVLCSCLISRPDLQTTSTLLVWRLNE